MRTTLLLLLSLLPSFTQTVLGAEHPSPVCRSLAAMLRANPRTDAEPGESQTLLESLAINSHGHLSVAAWETGGAPWTSYLHELGLPTQANWPDAVPATARADALVGVMSSEGSAGCANVSLFRAIGQRLVKIAEPYLAKIPTCARWGGFLLLASSDGTPFVARETRGADVQITQVAPWNGHSWEATCGVVVKYVPTLISQGAFCRAADCAGGEVEAKRIAEQVQADMRRGLSYQAGDNPPLDHLVDLAGRTTGTDTIPTSSDLLRYDNITYLNPYMATVDGHPTLALANVWRESPAGDSEIIGYAVALWQEAGDKLVPVAGFHFRTAHSGIKSVSVTR